MKIGVLGAGQLGRMIGMAGLNLGLDFRFYDTQADACAKAAGELVTGALNDEEKLKQFSAGLTVATSEFENIPAQTMEVVRRYVPFHPNPEAFAKAQDRLEEKDLFTALGIPTTRYQAVSNTDEVRKAVRDIGCPCVLKTRRLGYDGKGQVIIRDLQAAASAFERVKGVPCVVEEFIPFERECSILGVRSITGEEKFYPLVENCHRQGILHISKAPSSTLGSELNGEAQVYASRMMEHFNYAGILAIEFFILGNRVLANEFAPRVHNSGHWTIEGALTSQFENHLRAILGLPLGATDVHGFAAMYNLIGALPERSTILGIPNTHLHIYGKEPRPGRKVGHVTIVDETSSALEARLQSLNELINNLLG